MVHKSSDLFYTAFAPGPNLGADIIQNRYPKFFGCPGNMQVKIGKVYQYKKVGAQAFKELFCNGYGLK